MVDFAGGRQGAGEEVWDTPAACLCGDNISCQVEGERKGNTLISVLRGIDEILVGLLGASGVLRAYFRVAFLPLRFGRAVDTCQAVPPCVLLS